VPVKKKRTPKVKASAEIVAEAQSSVSE